MATSKSSSREGRSDLRVVVARKQKRSRKGRSNLRVVVARKQKRSSSSSREEETFKGVSFMGGLPLDLVVEVLRRLPLRSLVQMRTLSSSFNTLLCAPPKALWLCRQPPWLIIMNVSAADTGADLRALRELTAYCPLSGTWFPFAPMMEGLLSAMGGPGHLQVLYSSWKWSFGLGTSSAGGLGMASAGGLMCAVVTPWQPKPSTGERRDYLLVFNVFTGACKRLDPPTPTPAPKPFRGGEVFVHMLGKVFVHMFLDASAPGAYFVVLEPYCSNDFDVMCIYSSRTGCWMAASAQPSPCTSGDIRECDIFYFRRTGILAYSIHSDSWLEMPITHVEMLGVWNYVFKWQGRVFLASTRMLEAGFQVSVLASDTARWVEVARTPPGLRRPRRRNLNDYNVGFVVCGNLVCMSWSFIQNPRGYHSMSLQPLVYDLAGGSWYFFPRTVVKGNKTTGFHIGLLAVQPDLQATP